MDENTVNNVENTGVVPSTNSDDSMFVMLFKTVVVVLLGGLIVRLFRKAVNWFREGQRLRKEERERKRQEEFDKLVDKKAQEKLDDLLAQQVEQSEESKKD